MTVMLLSTNHCNILISCFRVMKTASITYMLTGNKGFLIVPWQESQAVVCLQLPKCQWMSKTLQALIPIVAVSCGYGTCFAVKTCDGLCHFILRNRPYPSWHCLCPLSSRDWPLGLVTEKWALGLVISPAMYYPWVTATPICGWLMVISTCVTLSGCRGRLHSYSDHFLFGDKGLLCKLMKRKNVSMLGSSTGTHDFWPPRSWNHTEQIKIRTK